MALGNAKLILNKVHGLSASKLLLLTAKYSRPALSPLCMLLLRPFVHDHEITIHYKQAHRNLCVKIRTSDELSDLHSILEVIVRKAYPLDPDFAADLIIDGGANIGLFSLQAAAVYPSARILACEPLPRNLIQVEKHLRLNNVTAEILPVCIGGAPRTIPFFCRGANASSFDFDTPYDSVLEIDVLSFAALVMGQSAQRILIKLDIEGMEVEALEGYIPQEDRAVMIFCELHGYKQRRLALEELLALHGWSIEWGDISGEDAVFRALSPAALALNQGPRT
jgi:FkbM family methyltransferase